MRTRKLKKSPRPKSKKRHRGFLDEEDDEVDVVEIIGPGNQEVKSREQKRADE